MFYFLEHSEIRSGCVKGLENYVDRWTHFFIRVRSELGPRGSFSLNSTEDGGEGGLGIIEGWRWGKKSICGWSDCGGGGVNRGK